MSGQQDKRALSRCSAFARSTAGSVAIMGAIFSTLIVVLGALAVDEGALYLQRRQDQSAVDIAAIVGAANIDKADQAISATLRNNGYTGQFSITHGSASARDHASQSSQVQERWLDVVRGRYTADPSINVDQRFQAGVEPYNAVKVTLGEQGRLYFARSFAPTPWIVARATASASAEAAFSIGSRLASLNGGVLNDLLTQMLGTNVSLSVMDYNALLNADVNVLDMFDALASELNITAGTYKDVLNSTATMGQIAKALASVSGSDPAANLAISTIANSAWSKDVSVPLSQVFDLGSLADFAIGERKPGLDVTAGVLDILTASGAIANGEHQVELDLGASVPGVTSLKADIAIGEPMQHSPWFGMGDTGEVVRTAQTRIAITAQIGGSGVLSGVTIRLPLYIDLAYAEAKLSSVSCPSGSPDSAQVDIDARPGIADLRIADVDTSTMTSFTSTPTMQDAQILDTPLIKASGQAHIALGNQSWTKLSFDGSDVTAHTVKTVSTSDYTNALTQSLLKDLKLKVNVAGLGLTSPAQVQQAIADAVSPVASSIDTAVYSLLSALGVRLGQADVRIDGVRCQRSVLIQ